MSVPDAAPAQMPAKREMVGRKPLHIFQGTFSGRWYATASYDERPGEYAHRGDTRSWFRRDQRPTVSLEPGDLDPLAGGDR